jgi:hypothetical protein
VEDIKDKVGAIFKACGKTAKDKADKVDKTKLLELLAEEVIRLDLSTVPTIPWPVSVQRVSSPCANTSFKATCTPIDFINELPTIMQNIVLQER